MLFADIRPQYGISVGYDSDPPSTKRSYIALPGGEITTEGETSITKKTTG